MNKKLLTKILGEKNVARLKILRGYKYINYFNEYKNKKKIIHILTPTHGNMGDQAIVYATNKYLKDNFSEYKLIEVYRKDIYKYFYAIKRIINKDDIIILIGGGNMGNLWIQEEIDRRFIIDSFKKNKIISMPQTISFTDDCIGKKEFNITKKIYNKNNNLTLIAREKKSYKIMKENFKKNNIILNPDTVLYLNDLFDIEFSKRKGIITCIRNDKESLLKENKHILINELKKNYNDVYEYDTVIDKLVSKENREKELKKMLNTFRGCKLVITDRLHGMVFAAITKTPCIVTKSLDHKVIGTYEWIKELNYIRLVDNFDFKNIKPLIDELEYLKEYTKIDLNTEYFYKLKDKLI